MENQSSRNFKTNENGVKIETKEKDDFEQMTVEDFPPAFSQFKEGIHQINEIKAP